MVNGDGNKDSKEVKAKWCPLLKEWCGKDEEGRCAFKHEMTRNMGGLVQKFNMCAFNAMVLILSEMTLKLQGQQSQPIQVPKLYRG